VCSKDACVFRGGALLMCRFVIGVRDWVDTLPCMTGVNFMMMMLAAAGHKRESQGYRKGDFLSRLRLCSGCIQVHL
jgi:hypothetical protein